MTGFVSSQFSLHLAVKVACTIHTSASNVVGSVMLTVIYDWFLCVNMTVTCVGQSAKAHAKDMRVYHYLVSSGAWEQG